MVGLEHQSLAGFFEPTLNARTLVPAVGMSHLLRYGVRQFPKLCIITMHTSLRLHIRTKAQKTSPHMRATAQNLTTHAENVTHEKMHKIQPCMWKTSPMSNCTKFDKWPKNLIGQATTLKAKCKVRAVKICPMVVPIPLMMRIENNLTEAPRSIPPDNLGEVRGQTKAD